MFKHFTQQETILGNRRYVQQDYDKPNGLWLSTELEWENFCIVEGFNLKTLAKCYNVELDLSKMLVIETPEQFRAFENKYKGSMYIDWYKVSQDYAGISIPNYLHQFRLLNSFNNWYYSWDIGCACIWDLSCITKFELK